MGRRALVVANWKMHGQKADIAALSEALLVGLAALSASGDSPGTATGKGPEVKLEGKPECGPGPEIVLCPPFPFLAQVQIALQGSALAMGAQNLFAQDSGAFTGEVSAPMLKDFDCRYVLVGHSERRQLFGENDAQVAAKFAAAQQHGLIPVLCIGESAAERDAGITEAVVSRQVETVLKQVGAAAFGHAVIAYEPVWAIGSGTAATPENAQAVHAYIRAVVARADASVASGLRILYGGSVNAANAGDFAEQADIDGALVGGASLVAEEFIAICARMGSAKAPQAAD
jgi:triosephosphate isomerase